MKTFKNLFLGVFALLVSNAARGFASGLARSLAFAATAVVNCFGDIFGFDSFDSVHGNTSEKFSSVKRSAYFHYNHFITLRRKCQECYLPMEHNIFLRRLRMKFFI